MKVAFALIARDVRLDEPRRIDLLGVLDRLEMSAFPARVETLYLVVRYEVLRTELGRPQTVELLLSDEDGGRLFASGRRLTVVDRGEGTSAPGEPEYSVQAYGVHGLVFEAPGTYAFDILINGAHAAHVPLFVRAVAASETAGGDAARATARES